MTTFTNEIDASGLKCPAPIIKASKALKKMSEGETLKVISTDVGSLADMSSLCKQKGYEMVEQEKIDDSYLYFIKK